MCWDIARIGHGRRLLSNILAVVPVAVKTATAAMSSFSMIPLTAPAKAATVRPAA